MDDDRTQQITVSLSPANPITDTWSRGSYFDYVSASLSHVGCVRTVNEDACLEMAERQLWLVADGMGGHQAGDLASRTVVDHVRAVSAAASFSQFVEQVEDRLIDAHKALCALNRTSGRISGSTVIGFLAHSRQGLLLWAGDSRAYLSRGPSFQQLTRDHSFVEELLASGAISPEEARNHPRANVITRAVGAGEELVLDLDTFELADGDTVLLCSDGLYKELEDPEIAAIMAAFASPALIVQELVNRCLARHARDNVTVVAIRAVRRAPRGGQP